MRGMYSLETIMLRLKTQRKDKMDTTFERRDKIARQLVEKARTRLLNEPLEAIFPFGVRQEILLGMKFQVSNLDYINNIVTFTLVE